MPYTYRARRAGAGPRHNNSGRHNSRSSRPQRRGVYIDPKLFVKAATIQEQAPYQTTNHFADFAFHDAIAANLKGLGYHVPSPIQDMAIPAALTGTDVIGIASTGTGKTAAFALPTLQRLAIDRSANAIVVAPTRELAQQIQAEFRALGKGLRLQDTLLIGGTGMGLQLRDLRSQPRIVIGTPGRIKDHLERGSLRLHNFNVIVLDEVDRMLDMGFVHDVSEILRQTSQQRQSLFFSATMDKRVRTLIDTFADNPQTISLQASSSSDNVHQDVVRYNGREEKIEKLHDLLNQQEVTKAIVFDETKRGVERLSRELFDRGFVADSIHGGKSQGQRMRALRRFKQSEITVLVATDVAARGIDVADITHVVNYSIPQSYDDYVHRVGRAGRAGRVGYALTFVEA